MVITWHGNSCFTLKDKKNLLVINPDKQAGKLSGNTVLSSLGKDTAEVQGAEKVIDWPGEYEIKDIPIVGFPAWTKSKSKEEEEGKAGEETILFYFQIGGIKCLHLDQLGHVLTSDTVKEIGDVDLLMINVGKTGNLGPKKATEIIESIEPRMLIPMGEGDLKEELKEIGTDNIVPQENYEIKDVSELPEDKRLYVILKKG